MDHKLTTEKVAIVTGAASGIGKALATNLITKGWRVACCDLQKDAGNAVASELGDHAVFYELDVCDYDAQAKVFSHVWDRWGRLDALLANAGHSDRGSIYIFDHRGKDDIPPKPALKSIKACYESFLYGVQLAIHFMQNIAMNAVLPGIVITGAVPQASIDATKPEQ
ncbi:hypothetical protein CBS470a_006957 [Colletotrichum nupharicola]|nr:hypothetical protein CBS470a_006957 [Colletotrichum nupharicola]